MSVSKPKMKKVDTPLSKYVTGGKRSKTTKIAWHYTGKSGVSAKSTVYNWFLPIAKGQQGATYASAHFVMEQDGTIYQMIPMNYIAYTTNSANSYSIGIECSTTGKDDHYSDKEYVSMVKLGAWLAQYYKLDPRKDFIRHYDITEKICPKYFVKNKSKWEQFKLDCYNYLHGKLKEYNIRNCTNGKGNSILNSPSSKPTNKPSQSNDKPKKFQVKVLSDTLNVRKVADWDAEPITKVKKGQHLDIVAIVDAKNGKTKMYKTDQGLYITSSEKYVKKV